MKVTIVANKFSEETRKKFQEEADRMAAEYHRMPHDISQYLAEKYKIAVSITYPKDGEARLHCHSCC